MNPNYKKYILFEYGETVTDEVDLQEVSYCYKQNLNVLIGTDTPAISLMNDKNEPIIFDTITFTKASNEKDDNDDDV